jgi:hypothetical protein
VFSLSLVSSNEFFLAMFMLACSLVIHWVDELSLLGQLACMAFQGPLDHCGIDL